MLLLLVALSLVLVGCDGDTASRPPTTGAPITSASAATPAPAPPADQCGAPATPAQSFWLPTPAGARLQAAMVGNSPDTAVFVHESGNRGLCGFWPYAEWLAKANGVRSVLVNQCGYGASVCPAGQETSQWLAATTAAVGWARTHGARQVTLVGASAGGIVALQAAASIRPRVDAVVDLSGERRWKQLDSVAAARRLRVPALFAVAAGDSYVSVATMRRLYQATPAGSKRLVVLAEGAGHGWELLGGTPGTDWSPLAVTVAAWIQGRHR